MVESWFVYLSVVGYKIHIQMNSAEDISATFDTYTMGLFDSIREATFMINFRALHIIDALTIYACGEDPLRRVTKDDHTEAVKALQVLLDSGALGVIDLCLEPSTYPEAWLEIVNVAIDASKSELVDSNVFLTRGQFLSKKLVKFLTPQGAHMWGSDDPATSHEQIKPIEMECHDIVADPDTIALPKGPRGPRGASTDPPASSKSKGATIVEFNNGNYTTVTQQRAQLLVAADKPDAVKISVANIYHIAALIQEQLWRLCMITTQSRIGNVKPDTLSKVVWEIGVRQPRLFHWQWHR